MTHSGRINNPIVLIFISSARLGDARWKASTPGAGSSRLQPQRGRALHPAGEPVPATGPIRPWAVGQQIPTVEELAAECGVARATIRQALDLLEGEGLIERYRAKGTFVRERAHEQLWCEVATIGPAC